MSKINTNPLKFMELRKLSSKILSERYFDKGIKQNGGQ
jgi:hypothetical protein